MRVAQVRQCESRGSLVRAFSLAVTILALAACVSTPVDPPPKVKTWHPEVNDQGVTREQAELACRQGIVDAGFGSVVLMSTMVEVCMRDLGFELK